jgi:hypothetical protein
MVAIKIAREYFKAGSRTLSNPSRLMVGGTRVVQKRGEQEGRSITSEQKLHQPGWLMQCADNVDNNWFLMMWL